MKEIPKCATCLYFNDKKWSCFRHPKAWDTADNEHWCGEHSDLERKRQRDDIAAMAMQGMLAGGAYRELFEGEIAARAYEIAFALMKA